MKPKQLKSFVKLAPFIMLGICVINSFLVDFTWYNTSYEYLSQMIGFSLMTNIYFLYFTMRFKMCMYTYISVFGLMLLNLLDIFNLIMPLGDYVYEIYYNIAMYICFALASIFFLKRQIDFTF